MAVSFSKKTHAVGANVKETWKNHYALLEVSGTSFTVLSLVNKKIKNGPQRQLKDTFIEFKKEKEKIQNGQAVNLSKFLEEKYGTEKGKCLVVLELSLCGGQSHAQ